MNSLNYTDKPQKTYSSDEYIETEHENNTTGTKLEAKVDAIADKILSYLQSCDNYLDSYPGQTMLGYVKGGGGVVCAAILAAHSPLVFGISFVVGIVFRSLSGEQVCRAGELFSKISNHLPTEAKALAVVISHLYLPILFPVTGGLYAGLEAGRRIAPHLITNSAEALNIHL